MAARRDGAGQGRMVQGDGELMIANLRRHDVTYKSPFFFENKGRREGRVKKEEGRRKEN